MLLSILILTLGLVSDVALGSDHLRSRHAHAALAARRHTIQPNSTPAELVAQQPPTRRRNSKRCNPKTPKTSSASHPAPSSSAKATPSSKSAPKATASPKPIANTESKPKPATNNNSPAPAPAPVTGGSKLSMIKNMHAFAGFVYAVSPCPSKSKAASDFSAMKKMGARTVITFDVCQGQDQATFYGNMIAAAQQAGMMIIPLIPTLSTNIQNEQDGVVAAIKANPGPVLAVALGDEPVYDNDFGSVGNLISHINSIKSALSSHGIPVSISDMAFGWQQAGGQVSQLAAAVDVFMVNNFPYFAGGAGNGDNAWNNFKSDMSFFQGIAKGKPIIVTQTGWPSDQREFPSNGATASVANEHKFYSLLDSHCSDFFKANNIAWMWRGYDDSIAGWGILDANGNQKFAATARSSC